MEFLAFASFIGLVVAWIALPIHAPAAEAEEQRAA